MSDDYLRHLTNMDEHVLDDLMKKFGQDVWNFAYSLTQNRTLSDDISQDVFLQAFKHIDSFRGESTVKTWLLRITRNVSINYRRSAFFRRVWLVNEIDPGRWGQSAEQDFMETEASNEVWRQVFRLRTKQREVIVLHAKYELSLQEIADVLQMPVGTVKSRLFGARKKLSKLLEERIAYEII